MMEATGESDGEFEQLKIGAVGYYIGVMVAIDNVGGRICYSILLVVSFWQSSGRTILEYGDTLGEIINKTQCEECLSVAHRQS
jgi:hypothetical protein